MATVKFTTEGQELRLKRLQSLRETRKDLEDLSGLKLSPEWTKLTRLLKRWSDFARNEEQHANAEHDAGEIDANEFSRKVTRSRQKASDFDFIVDILDKTKAQLEIVDNEIKTLEQKYKEANEVLS